MNIIHIITGLNNGGAEAVLYRLVTADTANIHHVVSMMDEGKYGSLLRSAGIEVTCLNMPQGRLTGAGVWKLWKLLRREKPDVVQTWMYHADLVGGVVARLVGVRRIFWGIHHTTLAPGKSSRITILIARLCAWLSHVVPKGIVCCAEKALQVHAELGYTRKKMRVIPNGYDLVSLSPDTVVCQRLRSEWGIPDNLPLLGMVGRFDPLKDHENLLCALGKLKQADIDFRCVLVGRDMEDANPVLRDWIQKYDMAQNILLLGQRTDIPAVMNALDVHVLSSESEAFPNVLAEGMACGTPCVTTDVGDAALIVGDTGWVVPSKDSVALSGAIVIALQSMQRADEWHQRCEQARNRIVKKFSIDTMLNNYHEIWLQ